MWNASIVQKTPQLTLTGTVWWLEVRNCAKVIFLRPCSKDLPVLMQLSQIARTVQVQKWNWKVWFCLKRFEKRKIDMEVLGLSLFPSLKLGRYVTVISRDISTNLDPLRWVISQGRGWPPCCYLKNKWKTKMLPTSIMKTTVANSSSKLEVLHLFRWSTHTPRCREAFFDDVEKAREALI